MSYNDDIKAVRDEMLRTIRNTENKLTNNMNTKSSEIFEKFEQFKNKTNLILETNKSALESLINLKLKLEKIDELCSFKNKADAMIITHEIRINNSKKDIDDMRNKYDKIICENLIVPGYIGSSCKFKNISEYLMHNINDVSKIKLEKDSLKKDMKDLKIKYDGLLKTMVNLNDISVLRCKEYTDSKEKDIRNYVDAKIQEFDDKIMDIRTLICKFQKDNELKNKDLNEKCKTLSLMKGEILNIVNNKIEDNRNFENELHKKIAINIQDIGINKNNIISLDQKLKDVDINIQNIFFQLRNFYLVNNKTPAAELIANKRSFSPSPRRKINNYNPKKEENNCSPNYEKINDINQNQKNKNINNDDEYYDLTDQNEIQKIISNLNKNNRINKEQKLQNVDTENKNKISINCSNNINEKKEKIKLNSYIKDSNQTSSRIPESLIKNLKLKSGLESYRAKEKKTTNKKSNPDLKAVNNLQIDSKINNKIKINLSIFNQLNQNGILDLYSYSTSPPEGMEFDLFTMQNLKAPELINPISKKLHDPDTGTECNIVSIDMNNSSNIKKMKSENKNNGTNLFNLYYTSNNFYEHNKNAKGQNNLNKMSIKPNQTFGKTSNAFYNKREKDKVDCSITINNKRNKDSNNTIYYSSNKNKNPNIKNDSKEKIINPKNCLTERSGYH